MQDSSKRKKMALGRGLGALIPGAVSPAAAVLSETAGDSQKEFFLCDTGQIQPNRYQPRRSFSPDELAELSLSIKEQGIIQPLIVRKDTDGYELVAGERRLRAAKLAGLTEVPVIVKDVSDALMLEISIVENIQREDLNPLEESEAYHRLMEEFGLTQEQVAARVGKSRPAVANFLRLRQLPEEIKNSILDSSLSMGHAKVLLGAENTLQQMNLWRLVMEKGLSVRETERILSRMKEEKEKSEKSPPEPDSDEIYFTGIAENLSRHFGTKVQIKRQGKKGRLEIEFYNDEDLDRLLKMFNEEF
ncbi:MAG: ParB/RepB/Spo0J family partition protein [Desulfobacterales bacterium]